MLGRPGNVQSITRPPCCAACMEPRNAGFGSQAPRRAPESAKTISYQAANRPMAEANAAPLIATAACTVTSRRSLGEQASSSVAVLTHPTSGPPTHSALMVKETAFRLGGVRASPVRFAAAAKMNSGNGLAWLPARPYRDKGVSSDGSYGTATWMESDSGPAPGTVTARVANADARRRR